MQLSLSDLKELLCGSNDPTCDDPSENLGWCIVVLDRGFVVVGRVQKSGCYMVINDCSCVRKWGTTKGLGQLASSGPLENTVLDPQPQTKVHELQVVQIIECVCEVSKWKP